MKKVGAYGPVWARMIAMGLLMGLVMACKKNKEPAPMTLADVVAGNADFTILTAAIRHADFGEALKSGSLTLLAPNDEAFRASGFADAAAVTALPAEQVRDLLKYHVLTTRQSLAQIGEANGKTVANLAEKPAYVKRDGAGNVFINNVRIIQPDLPADNGTIQVIERVLVPITQNLVQALRRDDLMFALAAAERAAEANSAIVDIFMSPNSQYTFLAPSNQAFKDRGFPTAGSLSAANRQVLADIILNHLIPGRFTASDFASGNVTTAAKKPLRIEVNNGIKVTGGKEGKTANVEGLDILATNGVIHRVDQLLIP